MTASDPNHTQSQRGWRRVAERLAVVSIFIGLCVFLGIKAREAHIAGAEAHCENELKQVWLALEGYHDTYEAYPAAHGDGHSWRIRVLPFLTSTPQYWEYDFGQPWSAPGNMVHTRSLPSYRESPDEKPWGKPGAWGHPFGVTQDEDELDATSFVMIVGEDAFGHPTKQRLASEITDGLENTIAVVEIAHEDVHWLSPVDLDFDTMSFQINDGPQSISSNSPSGPAVLFCDGTVCRLRPDLSPEVVKALCTINGGEDISRDAVIEPVR